LICSHGATYYDAPGEADELCAMLVLKNKVWACLSEDMDMFVYGCSRVIRYLSLMNHTAVLYDLKGILDELGINQQQLREICVLSGTDYNTTDTSTTLYNTLKLFKKFKRKAKAGEDFYNWLLANTSYIRDYETLRNVYEMFDLSSLNHDNLKVFEDANIANGRFSKDDVKSILKEDGFLFPVR
jgi:5'-3' exonuclease